jgi:hypothetical protein
MTETEVAIVLDKTRNAPTEREIAEALHAAFEQGFYKTQGFSTFEEYLQVEWGLCVRTGQRLRQCFQRLEIDLDLPPVIRAKLWEQGHRKLCPVLDELTPQNAPDILAILERTSHRELEKARGPNGRCGPSRGCRGG